MRMGIQYGDMLTYGNAVTYGDMLTYGVNVPDHASCVFHSIVRFRSFSSSTHASCITLFLPVHLAFDNEKKC